MGWKNVKEHYRIGHHVQVTADGICIGSSFIHNIIVISLDGAILKRYEGANADLARYQGEMEADQETLRRLIETPDTFSASIPVFTYDGGAIVEKQCEQLGWPNVTHAGEMMYENTFSPDRDVVVRWAKQNAQSGINCLNRSIAQAESELERLRAERRRCQVDLETLNTAYPTIVATT